MIHQNSAPREGAKSRNGLRQFIPVFFLGPKHLIFIRKFMDKSLRLIYGILKSKKRKSYKKEIILKNPAYSLQQKQSDDLHIIYYL